MSGAIPAAAIAWALNAYYRKTRPSYGRVHSGAVQTPPRTPGYNLRPIARRVPVPPPRGHNHTASGRGQHTQVIVARNHRGSGSRTSTKSKKRKKTSPAQRQARKTKKVVKRAISQYFKFNHGPKMTVELYQKYATAIVGGLVSVTTTGLLNSAFEEQAHAFLPVFTNSQMTKEFRINESTSGAGSLGILDPPGQEIYSAGVKTAYTMNWIKNSEQIVIDNLLFRLYLSNTADTKLKLRVVEWVCNDSSNIDPMTRCTSLYNQQRCFDSDTGYPTAGNIAAANLFKQPPFSMAMVPEFTKFWKKGSFHRTLELLPGESAEVVIPFSKIMWNQAKILKESDAAGPEEYQKNISRMIQVNTVGQVGYDASVSKVAAFQATQLNYRVVKKLTAHRMDTWGRDKRNYQLNFVTGATGFTYQSVAVAENQATVTGPVSSQFYTTAVTD